MQRAAEVSFDRLCVRVRNLSASSFLQRRAESVAYRSALALGISAKRPNSASTTMTVDDNDLAGPLLASLAYAVSVSWGQFDVLLLVLATWAVGSLLVFLLFRMLGSSHDLGLVMSAVGYSTLPLLLLQPIVTMTELPLPWFAWVIKCVAVLFASRSASLVLVQESTEKKIFLFELPLVLLYVYLLGFRSGG